MIKRIWHGWTSLENADRYEELLRSEIFPGIAEKGVPGYLGIELYRRPASSEVEFVTVMSFDSWAAVEQFAGDDHQASYVPLSARALLSRFDSRSAHYTVRESIVV